MCIKLPIKYLFVSPGSEATKLAKINTFHTDSDPNFSQP